MTQTAEQTVRRVRTEPNRRRVRVFFGGEAVAEVEAEAAAGGAEAADGGGDGVGGEGEWDLADAVAAGCPGEGVGERAGGAVEEGVMHGGGLRASWVRRRR